MIALSSPWRAAIRASIILTVVPVIGARAQQVVPGLSWSVWAALGPRNEVGARGRTTNRVVASTGARVTNDLSVAGPVVIQWLGDVVPFELSTNTPLGIEVGHCAPNNAPCPIVKTATAYGFSFSPIGLGARVTMPKHLVVSLGATAGIIHFDHNVPVPGTRRTNFVGRADVDVGCAVSRSLALEIGLLLGHVSNAHSVDINPGMNTRSLRVAVTVR